MPRNAPVSIPPTYAELLREVRRVLIDGQREIDRVWVRSYHETGRLIVEHILLKKERADYGAHVYRDLARDMNGSVTRLYQCAQFYRCFPILHDRVKLTWSHYRALCQVEDETQRRQLLKETEKRNWNSGELETQVREINAAIGLESGPPATKPGGAALKPRHGIVGYRRVATVEDTFGTSGDPGLCLDCGFNHYLPLTPAAARDRKNGEIVRVAADGGISAAPEAKPADLFTYAAKVRRTIDGDTLEVSIALPTGVKKLKLRLRGLDCPEIATPEGRAAKIETERLVAAATEVIICTSKPDKYDRYLADVFLQLPGRPEIFLNNHLLENGFAERKDAWEFGDWAF